MIGAGQTVADKLQNMREAGALIGCGAFSKYPDNPTDPRFMMGTQQCEDDLRALIQDNFTNMNDAQKGQLIEVVAPFVIYQAATDCTSYATAPEDRGSCFHAIITGATVGTQQAHLMQFPWPDHSARMIFQKLADQIRAGTLDSAALQRQATSFVKIPPNLKSYLDSIKTQYPTVAREAKRLFYEALAEVKPLEQFDAASKIADQVLVRVTDAVNRMNVTGVNNIQKEQIRREVIGTYVYSVGSKPDFTIDFQSLLAALPQELKARIPAGPLGDGMVVVVRRRFVEALHIYRKKPNVKQALQNNKTAMLQELGKALTKAIEDRGKTELRDVVMDLAGLTVIDVETEGTQPTKVIFGSRAPRALPLDLIEALGALGNSLKIVALEHIWYYVLEKAPEAAKPGELQDGLVKDLALKLNAKGPFEIVMNEVGVVDKAAKTVELKHIPGSLLGKGKSINDFRDITSELDLRGYIQLIKIWLAYKDELKKKEIVFGGANPDLHRPTSAALVEKAAREMAFPPSTSNQAVRSPNEMIAQGEKFFKLRFSGVDANNLPILKVKGVEGRSPTDSEFKALLESHVFYSFQGELGINPVLGIDENSGFGMGLWAAVKLGYTGGTNNWFTAKAKLSGLAVSDPGRLGRGNYALSVRTHDSDKPAQIIRLNGASGELSAKTKFGDTDTNELKFSVEGGLVSVRPTLGNLAFNPYRDPVNGLIDCPGSKARGGKAGLGLGFGEDAKSGSLSARVFYGTATAGLMYDPDAETAKDKGAGVEDFAGEKFGVEASGVVDFLAGSDHSLKFQGGISYIDSSGGTDEKPDAYEASQLAFSVSMMYQQDWFRLALGGRYIMKKPDDKTRWTIAGAMDFPIELPEKWGKTLTPYLSVSYTDENWQQKVTPELPVDGDYVECPDPEQNCEDEVPDYFTQGKRGFNIGGGLEWAINDKLFLHGGLSVIPNTNHEVSKWSYAIAPYLIFGLTFR